MVGTPVRWQKLLDAADQLRNRRPPLMTARFDFRRQHRPPTVASIARVHGCFLGGMDNYPLDREVVEQIVVLGGVARKP
jgi:hypothetical protein